MSEPVVILHTPRFYLRQITRDDLDFLAAMVGDAEVMRYYPQVLDRAGAQAWLERMLWRYETDGVGFWLVVDRTTNEPRGQVGVLMQEVDGVRETEVGYMIHRPFWRQGIATEAALACHEYVFRTLDRPRVIALVRPVNTPSQATARRLGMTVEKQTLFKDYEHDVYIKRR